MAEPETEAYIFAPSSEALNHRTGQSHGEWSFWTGVGASDGVAGLVGSHIDSVIPKESSLNERRKSRGESWGRLSDCWRGRRAASALHKGVWVSKVFEILTRP